MSVELNQSDKINSPKVSVCIASYNHARYLREMLDSVLAQTFRDFEIVVVDDGSQDNSLDILKEYSKKFDNIKIFTHEKHANKGISITTNLAIKKSRGDFVSFVGSDDVLYPEALEYQIKEIEKRSGLAFVYGKCRCINQNGEILDKSLGENFKDVSSPIIEIITGNGIPAVTVMTRKDCLESVGLYDKDLVFGDWHLWVKLLAHYDAAFIDHFICKYRIHDKNISIGISSEKYFTNSKAVMVSLIAQKDEIGGLLPSQNKVLSSALKAINEHLANSYLDAYIKHTEEGKLQTALSYLVKAAKIYPLIFLRIRRTAAVIKKGLIGGLRWSNRKILNLKNAD